MRTLLSAFACAPGIGSEEEVGLQALVATATEHRVWVLTGNDAAPIERHLAELGLASRVHVVAFRGGRLAKWLERALGTFGHQMYYESWQRRARKVALALDREVDFDLTHSVTYATCWASVGVAQVPKPFVWGPVGGAVETPPRLWSVLGVAGIMRDLARWAYRTAARGRHRVRIAAQSSALILAQNQRTAAYLTKLGAGRVEVVCNSLAALPLPPVVRLGGIDGSRYVAFVARLLPYKAPVLAVEALARARDTSLRLKLIGSGPEANRVRRRAKELGVSDRVDVLGRLPREETLALLAGAVVLIHPAVHEDGSLAVAESLALGVPVVALDWGGPPVTASYWPTEQSWLVSVAQGRSGVATDLADGIDHFASRDRIVAVGPTTDFGAEVLAAYRSLEP